MQSRRSFTPCKGRELKADELPSSAVSSAVIYGRATKEIVLALSANSAIRISSERMVLTGVNSIPQPDWRIESNKPGNQLPHLEQGLWYSPEANRSCNWTLH